MPGQGTGKKALRIPSEKFSQVLFSGVGTPLDAALKRGAGVRLVEERAREIVVGRVLLEALSAAFFTFLAGIGWGFIGRNIFAATLILSFATVAAVIAGVYTGVHEGCRFRHGILAIGGYSLMTVGIVILARYL